MRKILQLIILTFLFLLHSLTFAQTGKITGRVVDGMTNEPLPFVNIIIIGTSIGAATDIDGYYTIIGVRPGTYSVKASAIGYNSVISENVKVSIDLTTKIDFQLFETSVELKEEVVVIAKKPLVTKDLTSTTAIISSDEIKVLPVTEFQEVLRLKAGIVGGSVRGGRRGEVVYAIDGVPVTDVYDGSTVVDVNVNSIDELQFVSGAFNAEYGRALSGYVNIATKEGGNRFTGVVTSYIGDYVSTGTNIFRGIDKINPASIHDFEGNLSGPIISNMLTFYANVRYIYFGGWLNAKRVFQPWDITINNGPSLPVEERYSIDSTGDGKFVSMNSNEKKYGQAKLTFKPFVGIKINYNLIMDYVKYRDYDHMFSYNPDGDFKKFRTGITNILSLIHTLSSKTFYQANFTYFFKRFRQFVYEDPNDPRWTHDKLLDQEPKDVPSFKTGGTKSSQFKRTTNTYGFKIDLTSQVNRVNLVKLGFEFNTHTLSFDNINLLQDASIADPQETGNPFVKRHIPDLLDPNENLSIDRYIRKPIEISGYIQDKLEFDAFIINAGVRVDYFKTDGLILNDPTDPDIYRPRRPENLALTLEERKAKWYRNPQSSLQFSPRLGVAFPITDRGVVHFSYGHFFQIPNFELLYTNPEYKFGQGTGNLGIAGNPELKPQQTISGEVGVQQAFSDDISIDLTMYFRDIRNLAGTRADEIRLFGGSASYSQYVNSDFGSVLGVVFTLTKRLSNNWAATIDYTFQQAKGNASDPAATRNQIAGGEQPEIQLVRLNWDQTHTLNFTFSYNTEDLWGFAFIGRYGSGFPYTPDFSLNVSSLLTNASLKPPTFNVDLRAYKDFMLGSSLRLSFFMRVYNLFDIRNEINVYNDSGTADFTIEEFLRRNDGNPNFLVNSLDEYYRNPTFYSEPRRVEVGASFFF
ncbi:catecholate siderophore receptor CirA [bacterium BMS3Abin03]|nr:catecholate siderophore receptor CirA [bacterium BMS3Abin03]